jgi:hypothetical protein
MLWAGWHQMLWTRSNKILWTTCSNVGDHWLYTQHQIGRLSSKLDIAR